MKASSTNSKGPFWTIPLLVMAMPFAIIALLFAFDDLHLIIQIALIASCCGILLGAPISSFAMFFYFEPEDKFLPWAVMVSLMFYVVLAFAGLHAYFGVSCASSFAFCPSPAITPNNADPAVSNIKTHDFFTALYFSLVTFTTLGYGDLHPSSQGARFVAVYQAVLGYLYLGLIVASIITTFNGRNDPSKTRYSQRPIRPTRKRQSKRRSRNRRR